MYRSFRPRAAPPAPFLEQSLHILPSCSYQCFTIHPPESPHAMPLLALGKQRFNPDAALAHGFVIRLGHMIGADLLKILLIDTASEGSPALTVRAVCFEGAGIAGGGIGSILLGPFGVAVLFQVQEGSVWASIGILFGIVLELLLALDQTCLLALIDNGLEEATKQLNPVEFADARRTGMIG